MLTAGSEVETLAQGVSEDEWRSWQFFGGSASLLYQEIDTALTSKYDLTLPDVQLLHRLSTDPRRCARQGDLAETLVLRPSRVAWQVRRLENRGLVRRVRSREDKRIFAVEITRKGQDHLRPALRTYSAFVRWHYLAPLTREQMIAVGDSTRRVGDGLRSAGLTAAEVSC